MTVPVYNATQTLAEAKSAVDSALSAYYTEHNGIVTNAITKEEILAIAQKVVTNPNIEVRFALINGFNFAPATEDKAGSLNVKILLSRSIFERKTCTKSFTITKLDTISGAKANVIAALNDATNKNLYGVKDEAGVLAAATCDHRRSQQHRKYLVEFLQLLASCFFHTFFSLSFLKNGCK